MKKLIIPVALASLFLTPAHAAAPSGPQWAILIWHTQQTVYFRSGDPETGGASEATITGMYQTQSQCLVALGAISASLRNSDLLGCFFLPSVFITRGVKP